MKPSEWGTDPDTLPFVQIYILSRNRLPSLRQTLESALTINYPHFEVIVSDNSTNEEVFEGLQNHPERNRFKLIRRPPLHFFNQHMNLIKAEVTAPFFIIFHDDDLFLPNCLQVYAKIMNENPQVGACAGNAKMIYSSKKSENLYFDIDRGTLVRDADHFTQSYYGKSHGHPPFPFYMFRTDVVRSIDVIYTEGLIHSDGPFIFKIMKSSALYWTPEVVGYYHLHGTNISRTINLRALNSMYHFFLRQTGDGGQVVRRYRDRNRLHYYLQNRHRLGQFLKNSKHRILIWLTFKFVIQNLGFYFKKLFRLTNQGADHGR